jgi:hypothetical protein
MHAFKALFMHVRKITQNATISFVMSVCLSVCMYVCMYVSLSVRMKQLGSHWTDFHNI